MYPHKRPFTLPSQGGPHTTGRETNIRNPDMVPRLQTTCNHFAALHSACIATVSYQALQELGDRHINTIA